MVTVLVTIVTLVAAGTLVLEFEQAPESNIKTSGDALWWALTTLSIVGYGDRFPVTAGGRVVGAVLMVAGIGLFGALAGLTASWFVSGPEPRTETES